MIYLFAFKWEYGIIGIWLGKTFSEMCIPISYVILLNILDWGKICAESVERQLQDTKKIEEIESKNQKLLEKRKLMSKNQLTEIREYASREQDKKSSKNL